MSHFGEILDFIRQNNQTQGDAQGQMAALQAASAAGGDPNAATAPQPGSTPGQTPIPAALAQQAAGTDTNMATGAPIDLGAAQRIYQQNKQMTGAMSDDTEAKLASAAQSGSLPTLYKYLPDDGKNLLTKMQKNGTLGFGDAAKLNGILTGAMKTVDNLNAQKATATAVKAQGLANDAAGMQNQLTGAQLQPQLAAIQRLQSLSQAQSGEGSSVLSPQAQAAVKQSLANPLTAFSAQYFHATGRTPPPEVLERFVQQQINQRKPIGVVSAGVETSKDGGIPQFDKYQRVYQKGDGSVEVDKDAINVPIGSEPPAQLLHPDTFQPISPATLANKGNNAVQSGRRPVVMTDAQQKAIADANDDLHALNQTGKALQPMLSEIYNYTQGGAQDGGRFNGVAGTKPFVFIRKLFGDNGPEKLDATAGAVIPQIMSQTKGIRSQKEFEGATSMKPEATDANETLLTKGRYWVDVHNSNVQYAAAKKAALAQGMSPGEAAAEASKAAPMPAPLEMGPPKQQAAANPQLQQAMAWAQQNPRDPRAAAILKRIGSQ